MTTPPSLPLYYPDKTLEDMEAALRQGYLRRSGWLESAEHKLALRDGKPVPWFTYAAIAFLERELTPDLSVFEYGGGQSTLYWAERVARVDSVDHDPGFGAYIGDRLPGNARLTVMPEGTAIPEAAMPWDGRAPRLPDPARDTRTFRSGQLNEAFRAYGLAILAHPPGTFDVVIVDGMARNLSAWAAAAHSRGRGFVVFDNADRDDYARGYRFLEEAGYRRMDFRGLGPINPYEWCTAIFYQPAGFAGTRWFGPGAALPAPVPVPAAPASQGGTGILVLGYNRPMHLQAVLESLRLQEALDRTHLWLDGTQARGEFLDASTRSQEIAARYRVAERRLHDGHLGIEKMMCDALGVMTARYDRVIVLEDDCFPTRTAIAEFEAALDETAARADVFSVYGHPFGTEPATDRDFSRFQGWGWAAQSARIRALLPELTRLFLLPEAEYLAEIAARMTPEIRARLDRTPGRNVLGVLARFFSWDSATAFLCAERGLRHRRTRTACIRNTGIVAGIGHFREDSPRLRNPPFNMIPLAEAWDHFDDVAEPCPADRDSYGLEGLDLRIRDALPEAPGFLIEIGAHDGVLQSNSVILERAGWRGMLIEALPGPYARCRRTRPGMIVEHAACVAADYPGQTVTMTDVGLMTLSGRSALAEEARAEWLSRGEGFAGRPRQEIEVPAATLSGLLDKHGQARLDLLLLDVEGAETDVLDGLDFARHAPRFIVAEDAYDAGLADYLAARSYTRSAVLLERRFTRDCLYVRDGGD